MPARDVLHYAIKPVISRDLAITPNMCAAITHLCVYESAQHTPMIAGTHSPPVSTIHSPNNLTCNTIFRSLPPRCGTICPRALIHTHTQSWCPSDSGTFIPLRSERVCVGRVMLAIASHRTILRQSGILHGGLGRVSWVSSVQPRVHMCVHW